MTNIVNGKRIYGAWAGNPVGTPEDTTRCIEEVMESGRGSFFYQCRKKRGHGEGGLYCKIHDPEYIKARQQSRQAGWDKESAERTAKYNLDKTAVDACKEINPDNPQAVAESIKDIYEALKMSAEVIQEYIKEADIFCDHSVGICACSTLGRFARIEEAISKAESK